jgi:hypothetical protein
MGSGHNRDLQSGPRAHIRLDQPFAAPNEHEVLVLATILQMLRDGGVGAGLNVTYGLDSFNAKITEGDKEQDGKDAS